MKRILFCLILLINNCNSSQNYEIKSVVVKKTGGYTYYLSEGKGKVFKSGKTPYEQGYMKEYNFNVSNKKLNEIKRVYYENKLVELPDDYILYSSKKDDQNNRQEVTTITFYFENRNKKEITFYDYGNIPLDGFDNKKVEPLFKEAFLYIEKIKDSTREKSELPM